MTIERLEELKDLLIWMTGAPDIKFTQDQAELFSDGLQIIDSAIEMLKKERTRNELYYGAKLCPFCAGEATMCPEGDYWEITCDDCGVSKQGDTYEQALNEWNLRRL